MKLRYIANKIYGVSVMARDNEFTHLYGGFVKCSNEERAREMGYTDASKSYPNVARKDMRVSVREFDLSMLDGAVEPDA